MKTNQGVRALLACAVAVSLIAVGTASAATSGSILSSPAGFTLPLNGNGTGPVNTTVTITNTPGAGDVSVFFLCDTTGSMGGTIDSMKTVFTNVATNLATAMPSINWRWGVADYKDFEDAGPYAGGLNVGQTLTANIASAQAAINGWSANGGGDGPEQNIAALKKLAEGWVSLYDGRASAQRMLVWAGDIGGWENGAKGYPYPTLQATIDALAAQGVKVFAINPAGAGDGIDDVGSGAADGRNQASAITGGTGGQLFNNVNVNDANTVADAIMNAITTGVSTVGNISLTVDGLLDGWTVNVIGSPRIGPFGSGDSPVLTTFTLDVTAPGLDDTRTVTLSLRADGAVLDTEPLLLTTENPIPEPLSVLAVTLSLGGLGNYVRRRRRA